MPWPERKVCMNAKKKSDEENKRYADSKGRKHNQKSLSE
jgi:hypothetical protein